VDGFSGAHTAMWVHSKQLKEGVFQVVIVVLDWSHVTGHIRHPVSSLKIPANLNSFIVNTKISRDANYEWKQCILSFCFSLKERLCMMRD
jgi:hypothetical protein